MTNITLIHGNCVHKIKELQEASIQLTVTSPPYDNLRSYNGNKNWSKDDWETVIKELFRITKPGGVVVWVVGDATIDGSETGTSFEQALYAKQCGFNLHDTMIYEKNSSTWPAKRNSNRYTQIFEYMFVFSKGKPKCNLICDKPNKWAGFKDFSKKFKNPVPEFSPRTNIWRYVTSFNGVKHPAPFPEKLAYDHVVSWSDEGDTVFDPFTGSGTTGIVCKKLNRNFVGIELDKDYFELASTRINGSVRV